jgi:hypothetical protein
MRNILNKEAEIGYDYRERRFIFGAGMTTFVFMVLLFYCHAWNSGLDKGWSSGYQRGYDDAEENLKLIYDTQLLFMQEGDENE